VRCSRSAYVAAEPGQLHFGTEVEAVYAGNTTFLVVVARHWASIEGRQVHGTQALLVTADGDRIRTINALSRAGPASGIWD
jgi:hypothetical protein